MAEHVKREIVRAMRDKIRNCSVPELQEMISILLGSTEPESDIVFALVLDKLSEKMDDADFIEYADRLL